MLRALSRPCCGLSARLCECNPKPSRCSKIADRRGCYEGLPAAVSSADRGSGDITSANGKQLDNIVSGASHRAGNASEGISSHRTAFARTHALGGKSEKYPLNNDGQLNSFNHGESV